MVLIGRSYAALCVLERLIERGEAVVAFVGQEGGDERDFCEEMHDVCSRHSIPARSARKLGEEAVRWLEDRIRPELAINIGTSFEIPLAIGGNSRLGLVELVDSGPGSAPRSLSLRQRGRDLVRHELAAYGIDEDEDLCAADAMVALLEKHLADMRAANASVPATIPFQREPLGEQQLQAAAEYPDAGAQTGALEKQLASYVGADACVAVHSVSRAFGALFAELGLGQGDEVICPAIAGSTAFEAIAATGAQPVLADVQAGCLTLDPECVRTAITGNTRAILVSHPFGQPAELDAVYGLAAEARLEVIEDASAALGARFEDSRIGRSPCAAVFRLPLAGLSPGAAPALIALPEPLADRVRTRVEDARLGDGLARLVSERLTLWEDELSARRRVASRYSSELVPYDAFHVPATPERRLPTFAGYLLRLTRFSRTSASDLRKLMAESGIETRALEFGLEAATLAELPVAEQLGSHALLLPCHPQLDPELDATEIDSVLDAIFGYAIG